MFKIQNLSELAPRVILPAEAIDFLSHADGNTPCGHYEFGKDCYVNVMTIETKPESGLMEAHRAYIDVQMLLDGEETILWSDTSALTEEIPYNADKDVAFYRFTRAESVTYKTGEGIVLFPADAHLPGRAASVAGSVKKAVVKVRVK